MEKLDSSVETVSLYNQRQWSENVYNVGNTALERFKYGVDENYLSAVDYVGQLWPRLSPPPIRNRRCVALLDAKSARSLFEGRNPIGGTVEIQGMPYTVVGVVSPAPAAEPVINSYQDYWMYLATPPARCLSRT